MKQSDVLSVPTTFRAGDGLETSSAVTEALGALGGPPRGWSEALERARSAEFLLFRATSTGLGDDVLRLEAHLAECRARRETAAGAAAVDLDLGIANTKTLLAAKRELLAAVPEEAERIATQRAREQRRLRYDHRAAPQNADAVTAVLDLADAVQADAEAQAKEQAAVEALYEEVMSAHHAATRLLVRELVAQIHDAARACKSAVGSKALRHGAFPAFAPPEIGQSYSRAQYLRGLVHRLGGDAPDVDRVFSAALGEDDFRTLAEVFRKQIGYWPRMMEVR